jgi:hypothetical protein
MPVYDLCKALHAVYIDREAAMAARAGDWRRLWRRLDGHELTPEERGAIEGQDLVALYRLGAHPLLVFHFASVMGSRESYVREVVPRLRGIPNPFTDYYRLRQDPAGDRS